MRLACLQQTGECQGSFIIPAMSFLDSDLRRNDDGVLFWFPAIPLFRHSVIPSFRHSGPDTFVIPSTPSFQRKLESSGLCNTFPRKRAMTFHSGRLAQAAKAGVHSPPRQSFSGFRPSPESSGFYNTLSGQNSSPSMSPMRHTQDLGNSARAMPVSFAASIQPSV